METAPNIETQPTDAELRRIARIALMDTLLDYHLAGHCTLDEAVAEYHRTVEEDGIAQ